MNMPTIVKVGTCVCSYCDQTVDVEENIDWFPGVYMRAIHSHVLRNDRAGTKYQDVGTCPSSLDNMNYKPFERI